MVDSLLPPAKRPYEKKQQIIELEKNQSLNLKDAFMKPNKFKSLSEDSKFDFKTLSHTQQYNVQNEVKNISNFITLSKITEQEKTKIIQRGETYMFHNSIKKVKKYYESKDPSSLFQLRGYKIKYENFINN